MMFILELYQSKKITKLNKTTSINMTEHRKPRQLLNEIINAEHLDSNTLIDICLNLGWTDQQIIDVCKVDQDDINHAKVESGEYEWSDNGDSIVECN